MNAPVRAGLDIALYDARDREAWDAFVAASKNGSFLFNRGYMEYHADRFYDHSLVVRRGDEIIALLPAHRLGNEIHSHNGLTYGGFVVSDRMTTPLMLEIFQSCQHFLSRDGIRVMGYKTIPHIYHRQPAEEDRYALFRNDAVLYRRDLLSTIDMGRRSQPQARRRRGAAKAEKADVRVGESKAWRDYWDLLTDHLAGRYGVAPVHRLDEIMLLRGRFSANIRLFAATRLGALIGGVVIYETATVAHLQYAAATPEGLSVGCLDLLFLYLLNVVYENKRWFDFGNSTEQQGRFLNDGLIEQKEGFGGRAVAHDFYRLAL